MEEVVCEGSEGRRMAVGDATNWSGDCIPPETGVNVSKETYLQPPSVYSNHRAALPCAATSWRVSLTHPELCPKSYGVYELRTQ